MSTWAHVNASIRIDSLRLDGEGFTKRQLDDLVAENIPEGSEGPLYVNSWVQEDICHMAAYTVNIFGDLRDYNSFDDVINWANGVFEGEMIRQGVIQIDIGYETRLYWYDTDVIKFIQVWRADKNADEA